MKDYSLRVKDHKDFVLANSVALFLISSEKGQVY